MLLGGWQFWTSRPMMARLRGKNPLGPFTEKCHAILGIHEGQIHGQAAEDPRQLRQRQGADGKGQTSKGRLHHIPGEELPRSADGG
jgi:hypothetical protein